MAEEVLQRNCRALAQWDPEQAAAIEGATGTPETVLRAGRSGETSATIRGAAGREIWLHSRYAPGREADRVVADLGSAATCVCFGFGAGWVARSYLNRYRHAAVLVFEPDLSSIRAVLSTEPSWAEDLARGRLQFADTAELMAQRLARMHHPPLRDGVVVHTLPGRERHPVSGATIADARNHLTGALREIAAEHATIRRFGVPWLTHTVANAGTMTYDRQSRAAAVVAGIRGRVFVVGAGPSLDESGLVLYGSQQDTIIAVDTAVPALRRRGIAPDIVVSLDPQGWSSLHLRHVLPRRTVLIADLGVSPQVRRSADTVLLVASRHPLHQLMRARGLPVATLFDGPETVGEAACDVAATGDSVSLVGFDGAYPRGATYARGTYHHDLAGSRQRRLAPAEHFFAAQVYPRSEQSADSDTRPVFYRREMTAAAERIRRRAERRPDRQADTGPADGPAVPSPAGAPDVSSFWSAHLQGAERAATALEAAPELSTPEVLATAGADGRAHMPVLAGLAPRLRERRPAGLTTVEARHLENGGAPALAATLRMVIRRISPFVFTGIRR